MSALPPDIDFRIDKSASPERVNRAMAHLDARLRMLEIYRPKFDAELALIQQTGLDRINEAILPVYERLTRAAALGLLNAPIEAGTTAQFALGPITVIVALAPPLWSAELAQTAAAADGMVLWGWGGFLQESWNPDAAWWRATLAFLQSYKDQPK